MMMLLTILLFQLSRHNCWCIIVRNVSRRWILSFGRSRHHRFFDRTARITRRSTRRTSILVTPGRHRIRNYPRKLCRILARQCYDCWVIF